MSAAEAGQENGEGVKPCNGKQTDQRALGRGKASQPIPSPTTRLLAPLFLNLSEG